MSYTDADRFAAAVMLLSNVPIGGYAGSSRIINLVQEWQNRIAGRPSSKRLEDIIHHLKTEGLLPTD